MSLMYTIKCVSANGDQYCHPCEGAYRVMKHESAYQHASDEPEAVMAAMVHDVNGGVSFSTDDYMAIYVENPYGKTVNHVFSNRKPDGLVEGGAGKA